MSASVCDAISQIPAEEWDDCAGAELSSGHSMDPFTTHRFLQALEDSGSVGKGSSWQPVHIRITDGEMAIAVMPLYVKYDSSGEFVFDHGWANAFAQVGGHYYPKLQAAIPFTPVSGRRFLTRHGYTDVGIKALAQAAMSLALGNNLSSLHITFCSQNEAEFAGSFGFMQRIGEQFHWQNDDYENFAEFLDQLSSRKRKNIRRERRQAATAGGQIDRLTGDDIRPEHWDAFWRFYQDTGARKWGRPYLTREFFEAIHETMRKDILLVMCRREDRYIAGALNFIGSDALFGRYWGCCEDHPCLHFEICYYQAIDHAIACRLSRIEAGAQGPHKLARGYLPVKTHSLHWIADARLRDAVSEYLREEHRLIDREISWLVEAGPFKRSNREGQ